MDFSAILILPYSMFVTMVVLVTMLILKRDRPRLLWPFLFSTLTAWHIFAGLPRDSEFGPWAAYIGILMYWAALGTIIGAAIVRLSAMAFRAIHRE